MLEDLLRLVDRLRRDAAAAWRAHRRAPLATLAIVATLALGIAGTAIAYSFVHAILLRPLPVHDPDRLVRIYHRQDAGVQHFPISHPELEDIGELRDIFADVAGERPAPFTLGAAGVYERVWGEIASPGYFRALGVVPLHGRFFAPDEEDAGTPVVVLGHGFWQQRFAGASAAIGADVHIDGRAFRVIGVAPERFRGTIVAFASDLWIPMRAAAPHHGDPAHRGDRSYFTMARLAPGVTVSQAQSALDSLGRRLQTEHPDTSRVIRFAALPESHGRVPPPFHGQLLGFSALALGVALLVAVIASVNAAGVLLARNAARRIELGIRLALGASRRRIFSQLLIEAATLATVAGALGVLLAWHAARLAGAIEIPIARGAALSIDAGLDSAVLAVAVAVAVATAVLSGLTPALEASRLDLLSLFRGGGAGRSPRSRSARVLLGAQVAISMLLLAAGGLFLQSLQHAKRIDPGFDPDRVVTTAADIRSRGGSPDADRQFWVQLIEEVRRLPQVESASLATRLPLELGVVMLSLGPDGFQPAPGQAWPSSDFAAIEPGYFETLRIPLLEGRDFDEHDTGAAADVIIVNDVLARRFWRDEPATGQYVTTPGGRRFQVAGVVRRSKYLSIGEDPKPYVYFPMRQGDPPPAMTVVARGVGETGALLQELARVVRRLEPSTPLYDAGTMSQRVALSLVPAEVGARVLGLVGLVGLALTSVGLFAAVAQAVSRRTYEIGVRRALGAPDAHVVWTVTRETMALVGAGLAVGLTAALLTAGALRSVLYRADALDPLVLVVAPAVLVLIAVAAAWWPARRATRISPAAALRCQ